MCGEVFREEDYAKLKAVRDHCLKVVIDGLGADSSSISEELSSAMDFLIFYEKRNDVLFNGFGSDITFGFEYDTVSVANITNSLDDAYKDQFRDF